MARTLTQLLYMSESNTDPVNHEADTPTSDGHVPGPNFVLGGFPRNGLPTKSATATLIVTLFLASLFLSMGAAVLFGVLAIPMAIVDGVSMILAVWLLVFIRRCCRSSKGFFIVLVLISVLLFMLFQTAIVSALLLSLFIIVSQGAMLITVAKKSLLVWIPLIPVMAATLALLIYQTAPWLAVCALLPWPCAWAVSFGLSGGTKNRSIGGVGLICLCSLTLIVTVAIVGVAWLLNRHGGVLNATLLQQDVESVRVFWVQAAQELWDTLNAEAVQSGLDVSALSFLTDEETVLDLVNTTLNILPGTVIALINVFSFLAVSALKAGLHQAGYGAYISPEVRVFRMSPCAAVVFILAFLVFLFSSEASSLSGTVAENVWLILEPGLALCGFGALMGRMLRKQRRGCLPILLFVLVAVFFTSILLPALALYGAGSTLFAAIAGRKGRGKPQNPA